MSELVIEQLHELLKQRDAAMAAARVAAKPHLDRAQALEAAIEGLAKPLVTLKEEGTVSLNVNDAYTVSFEKKVTRKANTESLQINWPELPEAVTKAFKFEAGINLKALRALSEEDAAVAAQYYSSTTGEPKMSISAKVQS